MLGQILCAFLAIAFFVGIGMLVWKKRGQKIEAAAGQAVKDVKAEIDTARKKAGL